MEIHEAKESGKSYYRIYTTYGKTDDLLEHSTGNPKKTNFGIICINENIGESTRKVDCRYLDNLKQALILYDLIYKEKVFLFSFVLFYSLCSHLFSNSKFKSGLA